ncbi:hypothetical protein JCM16303_004506 [Sporobolomyces ruberrimus]
MAAQFIGSVISLISKSDIRYQGVLHSIDPQAATVSLEKVRSLGTEGRKANPAEEVGPSDNVYDFIVFRASDVKDLQIEAPAAATPSNEPAMSDPAIVGTTAPPTSAAPAPSSDAAPPSAPPAAAATLSPPKPAEPAQPSPQQRAQQPPHSPYNMPPPPPHMGQGPPFGHYPPPPFGSPFGGPPPPFSPYGAPYPPFGAPGPFGGPGLPPGPGSPFMQGPPPPPMHLQQPPHQQQQDQASLKSPSASSAVAPSPSVQKQQTPSAPAPLASPGAPQQASQPTQAPSAILVAPATPQETRPETNGTASKPVPAGSESQAQDPAPKKQASDIEQLAKDMSRASVGPTGAQQAQSQQQQAPRARRGEDHVGASIFGGPTQQPRASQPRTQPGRTLQPFGAGQQQQKTTIAVPDADFDFASSNASFQKPSALPEAPTNPSAASTDATANGKSGEQDDFVVPPPAEAAPSAEASYNPSKSFFDSISSDAKTRADPFAQSAAGRHGGIGGGGYNGGRYDREKEREKNLEAFGESGAHLGRGGYRRGGGGGRGRRGGNGGGGGGGYQSGGGQRQYNNGPRTQQQ